MWDVKGTRDRLGRVSTARDATLEDVTAARRPRRTRAGTRGGHVPLGWRFDWRTNEEEVRGRERGTTRNSFNHRSLSTPAIETAWTPGRHELLVSRL